MRQGGTFMSKHNSSYMHKQNLLNDMPVDDHAGSPMNQTSIYADRKNKEGKSQSDVMNLRQNQLDRARSIYDAGDMSVNKLNEVVGSYNKSLDSIGNVNKRIDKVLSGHEFKLKDEK